MALRVIVEVEGDGFHLIDAKHVDMPAPAVPDAPVNEGVYAELRDANDETLLQRSLSQQLDAGVEVFAPGGAARRIDAQPPKQTVMLVLPDDNRDARSIVFLRAEEQRLGGGGGAAAESTAAPLELARFTLE